MAKIPAVCRVNIVAVSYS